MSESMCSSSFSLVGAISLFHSILLFFFLSTFFVFGFVSDQSAFFGSVQLNEQCKCCLVVDGVLNALHVNIVTSTQSNKTMTN